MLGEGTVNFSHTGFLKDSFLCVELLMRLFAKERGRTLVPGDGKLSVNNAHKFV